MTAPRWLNPAICLLALVACYVALALLDRQDAAIEARYAETQDARTEVVACYRWMRHTVYDSTARQGGPMDAHGYRLVPGNVAVHPASGIAQNSRVWLDVSWRTVRDVTAGWVDVRTLDEHVPGSESRPETWRAEDRWIAVEPPPDGGKEE